MSDQTPDNKRQQIDKILDLLKQFQRDQIEFFLEQWMWELDERWYAEGLPENIAQQLDELRKRYNGSRNNFINKDKDQ